jgi:hypothetical protein
VLQPCCAAGIRIWPRVQLDSTATLVNPALGSATLKGTKSSGREYVTALHVSTLLFLDGNCDKANKQWGSSHRPGVAGSACCCLSVRIGCQRRPEDELSTGVVRARLLQLTRLSCRLAGLLMAGPTAAAASSPTIPRAGRKVMQSSEDDKLTGTAVRLASLLRCSSCAWPAAGLDQRSDFGPEYTSTTVDSARGLLLMPVVRDRCNCCKPGGHPRVCLQDGGTPHRFWCLVLVMVLIVTIACACSISFSKRCQ